MKVSRSKSCWWTWPGWPGMVVMVLCEAREANNLATLTPEPEAWPDCWTSLPSIVISHKTVNLSSGVIWLFWGSSRSKLKIRNVMFHPLKLKCSEVSNFYYLCGINFAARRPNIGLPICVSDSLMDFFFRKTFSPVADTTLNSIFPEKVAVNDLKETVGVRC